MSEIELPEPWPMSVIASSKDLIYTADQMRVAILAERERCARVCDQYAQERDQNSAGAEVCAAAIRRGSV